MNTQFYMPSEAPDNLHDMSHMDSSPAPPVIRGLRPSSSMESLGGEGMLHSTSTATSTTATPEGNSSLEIRIWRGIRGTPTTHQVCLKWHKSTLKILMLTDFRLAWPI